MTDTPTKTDSIRNRIKLVRAIISEADISVGAADNGATDTQTLNAIEYAIKALRKLTAIVDELAAQVEPD